MAAQLTLWDAVEDQRACLTPVSETRIMALLPIHLARVLTYLRLRDAPVGLLLHFNTAHLTDGVRRVINAQAPRPPRSPWFT